MQLNQKTALNKEDFYRLNYVNKNDLLTEESGEDGGTGSNGGSGSCDCRWDITCQLANLGSCSNTDCTDTTLGCGWLFMQSCTNDCSW